MTKSSCFSLHLLCNRNFLLFFVVISLLASSLFAKSVDTFYGTLEIEEPVVLELLDCPPMQRLKKLHQYGVAYYTTHPEEYHRFDHSVGVFAILRLKGASLDEQVAGLLHDVSHTVFSHVGDWIFQVQSKKDAYQDDIHAWFLENYGIGKILEKHGYCIQQILHKSGKFLSLEQELPNLCADRIDYNLQGAYFRGLLTQEEAKEILNDLTFNGSIWIASKPDLIKKIVNFSLLMTHDCWGSAKNYMMSQWLAESILKAKELKLIDEDTIHYGTDDLVWNLLIHAKDSFIQERMHRIMHAEEFFGLSEDQKGDLHPYCKFRGIDPWVQLNGEIKRLTSIDKEIAHTYQSVKERMEKGWNIRLLTKSLADSTR